MARQFISASTLFISGSTNPGVIDRPANVVEGMLMIAQMGWRYQDTTIIAPAGWVELVTYDTHLNNRPTAIYYKVATASEPASYTWTQVDGGLGVGYLSIGIAVYEAGPLPTVLVRPHDEQQAGFTIAPARANSTAGMRALRQFRTRGSSSNVWDESDPLVNVTRPAGQNRRYEVTTALTGRTIVVGYDLVYSGDAPDAILQHPNSSVISSGSTIFLAPAGGEPPPPDPTDLPVVYAPGEPVGSFSRASAATYYDENGVVTTAATDVLRDSHYQEGERTTMVEEARTNNAFPSDNFTSWSRWPSFSSVTANAAEAPDATQSATRITFPGQDYVTFKQYQSAANLAGRTLIYTIWVRTVDGSTKIIATNLNARTSSSGLEANDKNHWVDGEWRRLEFVVTFASDITADYLEYGLHTFGIGGLEETALDIYAWGAQVVEDVAYPTSHIPTTSGPITRGQDNLVISGGWDEQEVTQYERFFRLDTRVWDERLVVFTGTGPQDLPQNRYYSDVKVAAGSQTIQYMRALGGEGGVFPVEFAGEIPAQSLSATVDVGAPSFPVAFAGEIPAQSLVATVEFDPPWDVVADIPDGTTSSHTDTDDLEDGTYEYRHVGVNLAGETFSNVVERLVVAGVEIPFSGAIPAQSLAATLSREVPTFPVEFAGHIPAQLLTAEITASRPVYGLEFSGLIPAQELVATVEHEAPTFLLEFAATIPAQTLEATVEVSAPSAGISFAATIPAQSLLATVEVAVPVFSVEFSGEVPAQTLAATVVAVAPSFPVEFAATIPAQSLEATVGYEAPWEVAESIPDGTTSSWEDTDELEPGWYEYRHVGVNEVGEAVSNVVLREVVESGVGISFAATIPAQSLSANVSSTVPAWALEFSGEIPVQELGAEIDHTAPVHSIGFSATIPAQTLEVEMGVQAPTSGISFLATIPVQSLEATLSREVPSFPVEFSGSIPAQSLEATVEVEAPSAGISFSATIPAQDLSATVEHVVPGFPVEFAGEIPAQSLEVEMGVQLPTAGISFLATIPTQSLEATLSREVPGFPLTFSGEIPVQSLEATLGVSAPSTGISFSATIPAQSLTATLSREVPGFVVEFGAEIPVQSLEATVGVEPPVYELGFTATLPAQELLAEIDVAVPVFPVEFGGEIPAQSLEVTLDSVPPLFPLTFSGVIPPQSLEAELGVAAPRAGLTFFATIPVQILAPWGGHPVQIAELEARMARLARIDTRMARRHLLVGTKSRIHEAEATKGRVAEVEAAQARKHELTTRV